MHTNPETLYLTVQQVADRFSVSTDTIYRWRRDGQFPAPFRLSPGTSRWRLADIVAYEETLITCFAAELGAYAFTEVAA